MTSRTTRTLGLMSGTSMDGLDCLLCDIDLTRDYELKFQVIDFACVPYSSADRAQIIRSLDGDAQVVQQTHMYLGSLFARMAVKFLKGRKVELVGSHGQTVAHTDGVSSLQIGDPAPLAAAVNAPVVYDVRSADIQSGGNGAPLVPFLDWLLFRNDAMHTITLNIGGISNLSFVPSGCGRDRVIGFDSGPGMSLIDECTQHFWKEPMDRDGRRAKTGVIHDSILADLMSTPYVNADPPKSTGRHEFGKEFLNRMINRYPEIPPETLLRTLVAFTAKSISVNIRKNCKFADNESRLIVAGGGVHHPLLMHDLEVFMPGIRLLRSSDAGVDPDLKEALLMAVLAAAYVRDLPANMPGVTGARGLTRLGRLTEFSIDNAKNT